MDASFVSDIYNISKNVRSKLISDSDREVYEMVNYYILSTILCLLGIVTNVMNIVVFYKQGFDNTMNISFFALAIADLCCVIGLFMCCVTLTDIYGKFGISNVPSEIGYFTGGLEHLCFSRITSWITVFITAERCLCITLPLKIKQLITPRRTTVILCTIYAFIIASFEPEFQTGYLGMKFDAGRNTTVLGIIFTEDRQAVEGVTFILYSILGFASFITVIIFTLILVIQLNRKSKWRRMATHTSAPSESISNKERKPMKMVVMLATVLIVCYTPGVLVSSVSFFEPEFSVLGLYTNAFVSMWSFVVVFQAFNSSVNIFLYYYMSTKYRETFRVVFALDKITNRKGSTTRT